ncbi:MAG: Alpha,alpha-trehalose-phosphate synthase [UDP-forming] [Brockia lithotrophica]|uniref:Alpha,alpha-trehalose-phosphate synthase [UDP-forming] n=1 Tax=Brockia lithotrophica TaxID=933949 RepID=A0A2T5G7F2_9BACL|nr:bifunctional alpha,alpha-trehalose-phosphate synthase (UDP-forming)/trehalose-phosphatase [Brockia lithotrophica]PTQ52123.1 MAG: Alpha,alpha-trehalose-phosphate synthase [UDP-forming] [Brockia lithotrophica]
MKLVIVANRLPYRVRPDRSLELSPGGLVSGLLSFFRAAGLQKDEYLWIGWPGNEENNDPKLREVLANHQALPVFLDAEEVETFYHGFSNDTLWPLLHSFPCWASFSQEHWKGYVRVNEKFARAALEVLEDDDIVWIHDYQLMLVPGILRRERPALRIGFFLHIPFPAPEVFLLLPWAREILGHLLGADLIGFHTYEYTQNFMRAVTRALGFEHDMQYVVLEDRVVRVDTFPLGVDFARWNTCGELPEVQAEEKKLREAALGRKVVFSADRLDYTKGIFGRLLAFERFLEAHPETRENVLFMLVVVPSREQVPRYREMKEEIERKVGEINGRFSSHGRIPVHYYYRNLSFPELCASYRTADAVLVTPLKDGMNLVAKEFVATRSDLSGTLILSEFAGSARELGEAFLVNPNSPEELARALAIALDLPEDEKRRRLAAMRERIRRYDARRWGEDFLRALAEVSGRRIELRTRVVTEPLVAAFRAEYRKAQDAIFFLDYDGTLVPLVRDPSLAAPDPELLKLLASLARPRKSEVVVISGRSRADLERWLGQLPIALVAEHGLWIRTVEGTWEQAAEGVPEELERLRGVLEFYVDRLPQAFLEEKTFSIAFHYRKADPEMAAVIVPELVDELVQLTANSPLHVLSGHKVVEVRPAGMTKGSAARRFLRDQSFVFAAGDDVTDEDLFRALPETAITVRVGAKPSHATYTVPTPHDLRKILAAFVERP